MLARQLGRVHAQAIRLLPTLDGVVSTSRCDNYYTFAIDSIPQAPPINCDYGSGSRCGGGWPLSPVTHSFAHSLTRRGAVNYSGYQSRSFASGGPDRGPPGSDFARGQAAGGIPPLPLNSPQSGHDDAYDQHDASDGFQDSPADDREPNKAEGDLDHLLTKWEAMMDGTDPEDALSLLVEGKLVLSR